MIFIILSALICLVLAWASSEAARCIGPECNARFDRGYAFDALFCLVTACALVATLFTSAILVKVLALGFCSVIVLVLLKSLFFAVKDCFFTPHARIWHPHTWFAPSLIGASVIILASGALKVYG